MPVYIYIIYPIKHVSAIALHQYGDSLSGGSVCLGNSPRIYIYIYIYNYNRYVYMCLIYIYIYIHTQHVLFLSIYVYNCIYPYDRYLLNP